ncbi:MAG: hypothetical protein HY445_02285 [Candidatus Niyogibacteria bacterium]|nr:hypothetical protein [Candidatus Niyogibacteria bacterium]
MTLDSIRLEGDDMPVETPSPDTPDTGDQLTNEGEDAGGDIDEGSGTEGAEGTDEK